MRIPVMQTSWPSIVNALDGAASHSDARGHKRASSPTLYTLPVSGLVNQISTIVHIISDLRRSDVVISRP